jgi:hypothetical protein
VHVSPTHDVARSSTLAATAGEGLSVSGAVANRRARTNALQSDRPASRVVARGGSLCETARLIATLLSPSLRSRTIDIPCQRSQADTEVLGRVATKRLGTSKNLRHFGASNPASRGGPCMSVRPRQQSIGLLEKDDAVQRPLVRGR